MNNNLMSLVLAGCVIILYIYGYVTNSAYCLLAAIVSLGMLVYYDYRYNKETED